MSLEYLIESGGYQSAQEAFQAITTASVERRDDQPYTWAGVADIIGPEATEALRVKFDTSGFGWVSLQLGGLGLPLSDSRVQAVLTGFAQMGLPGCDTLLAKGISMMPPWQAAGLAQTPTLAEVQAAWEVVTNPPEPDTQSHEILLTVNQRPDGTILAMARVTPVGLLNGQVVSRGQAQVITGPELISLVSPILENLTDA